MSQPQGSAIDTPQVPYISWEADVGEGGWVSGTVTNLRRNVKRGANTMNLVDMVTTAGEAFVVSAPMRLTEILEQAHSQIKGAVVHIVFDGAQRTAKGSMKLFHIVRSDEKNPEFLMITSSLKGGDTTQPIHQQGGEDDDLPF